MLTNEELMAMCESIASKAVAQSQDEEIDQLIGFFRARVMNFVGEMLAGTYANYAEVDPDLAKRLTNMAEIIEQSALCFETLIRHYWRGVPIF